MKTNKSTLNANSLNSIKSSFIALARKKLTKKEKSSLVLLSRNSCRNLTQAANYLSHELDCGLSTSWAIIRSLLSLKLIEEKHSITLSESSKFLVENELC